MACFLSCFIAAFSLVGALHDVWRNTYYGNSTNIAIIHNIYLLIFIISLIQTVQFHERSEDDFSAKIPSLLCDFEKAAFDILCGVLKLAQVRQ